MDFLLDDLDSEQPSSVTTAVPITANHRAVGEAAVPPTLVPLNATIPFDDEHDPFAEAEADLGEPTEDKAQEDDCNPLALSDHESEELDEDRADHDDWSDEHEDEEEETPRKATKPAPRGKENPRDTDESSLDEALGHAAEEDEMEMTREGVEFLLDAATTMIDEFEAIAQRICPHPLVFLPPPSASSRYRIAGMNKIRHRILAEQALLASCLRDEAYRRAVCSNSATLRVTVGLMKSEPAMMQMAFAVTIPEATIAAKTVQPGTAPRKLQRRNNPCYIPSTSVDVDMVTRGGLRWIKVKGMSARNFEYEVVGGRERRAASTGAMCNPRSLTDSLKDLIEASKSDRYRLPFGRRPHVYIISAEQPTEATIRALKEDCPEVSCCSWDLYQQIRNIEDEELLAATIERLNGHTEATINTHLSSLSVRIPVQSINFDVTALVALCCDICHGHAGTEYPHNPVLDRQSKEEASLKAGTRAVQDFLQPTLDSLTVYEDSSDTDNANANGLSEALSSHTPEGREKLLNCLHRVGAFRPDRAFMGALIGEDVLKEDPTIWKREGCVVKQGRPLNWIVSYQAMEEFRWILQTVAGPDELRRALWLFERVWIVGGAPPPYPGTGAFTTPAPAPTSPIDQGKPMFSAGNEELQSPAVASLKETGHIQARHKAVFGLADSLVMQSVTLTANRAFVQAALEQGVSLCVSFHPARALTEKKRLGTDAPDHEKIKRKR